MVVTVRSLGLNGIAGYAVSAECFLSGGLPAFDIVGLPDAAVREARERVRAAVKNCGAKFPVSRITVNLAPAGQKKAGTVYDLPIFVGLLAAGRELPPPAQQAAFIGELSLTGALRGVTGVLPMALAAKASGGMVIVQVETLAENRTIPPKHVVLPGIDVDYIVLSKVRQVQNPAYTGEMRMPLSQIPPMALNARKVIARRAAMELVPNAVVNLGIGIPEGVSSVANEEGIGDQLTLTVEAGPIGGVPASGADFGGSANADAIVDHPYQFDFYDGGGLDMAFLGMAECNAKGDVNVSKFKDRIAGCGGFINITQNTHKVVFCGTFTAKGLREEIRDGKLVIIHEGAVQKFIDKVGQITFSADYAHKHNQQVMFITERCVFVLTDKGLVLTEIAPGVDLQKDILDQMEFVPHIAEDLKTMDERIFRDEPMGLAQDIFEQQAS